MTVTSHASDTGLDPHRWLGELSEDAEASLLGLDDWTHALVGAIGLLHEDRVTVRTVTLRDRYVFVMAFAGDDTYHRSRFDHGMRDWPAPRYYGDGDQSSRSAFTEHDFARRRAYINGCLTQVFRDPVSLTTTLREGSYATPEDRAFLLPLVRAWWAGRLAEGCDSETARTMLGLTVTSQTWRLLSFPADGGPPVVDAT